MGLRNRTYFNYEQCFFITTTCYNWLKLIDDDEARDILTNSLNFLTEKYKCHLLGYVIMPNHLHFIIYFPVDNRLSDFMRDFKKFTSVKLRQHIESLGGEGRLESLRFEHRDQKFKVWMDRFDDVCITTADMLRVKLDYIHNNPLQPHWILAKIPEEYVYSSAGFYEGEDTGKVKLTIYSEFIW